MSFQIQVTILELLLELGVNQHQLLLKPLQPLVLFLEYHQSKVPFGLAERRAEKPFGRNCFSECGEQ